MLSCLFVILSTGVHVTMTMMYWTLSYRDPPCIGSCSPGMFKLVQLGPHCTGTLPSNLFKLVHYKVSTVDKRVVGILMECFLVHSIPVLNHLELSTETLYFYNSIWRFLHYSDNGDSYQMETPREVATKIYYLNKVEQIFKVECRDFKVKLEVI